MAFQTRTRLFVAGLLLLLAALLWHAAVAPQLLRIPADFRLSADVISTDDFFNAKSGLYAGPIFSKTTFSYDAVSHDAATVVIRNAFSVQTPENEPIFSVERLYGIQRITGEHVPELGDRVREGYLFAPRHLKRGEEFTYWHVNYDGPARMHFAGEEQLYGLPVFRYETQYEGITIDQTENLHHLPGVGTTRSVQLEPYLQLWIEPETGRMIKYKDDTIAYFYDLRTRERLQPWNHFSNTFDEKSVKRNVDTARWGKSVAQMVELYIPIALALGGLAALGACCGVVRRLAATSINRYFAGATSIAVASLSLTGWGTGMELATRLMLDGMNPITAVCFFILGSAIILKSAGYHRITAVAGGAVIAVGLLRLTGHVLPVMWQVDLALFPDAILSAAAPSRMAVFTALCFALIGTVLITSVFQGLRKLHVPETLLPMVIILSCIVFIEHVIDIFGILAMPIFISSAPSTAVLFVMTSVAMLAITRDHDTGSMHTHTWLMIFSVPILSILVTVVCTTVVEVNIRWTAETQFQIASQRAVDAIVDRLSNYINTLYGAKGYVESSVTIRQHDWETYVETLDIDHRLPGMTGMAYAPIAEENKGSRDSLTAPQALIRFIEPLNERNRRALGYDLFSEPARKAALDQARDTGKPQMTSRIRLVQEDGTDVQTGFLIALATYRKGAPQETDSQRRKSIAGFVSFAFRARDFIESIAEVKSLDGIRLQIVNGVDDTTENQIYNDGLGNGGFSTPRFTKDVHVFIAGRPWSMVFASSQHFGDTTFSRIIQLITLIVGIVMSMLVHYIFYSTVAARSLLLQRVEQRTQEISSMLQALDKVALVSMTDSKGDIIYANDRFVEISKYARHELIGQNHRILKSGHQPESLFIGLWKTISHGKVWRGEIKNRAKDGTYYWVDTAIAPLLNVQGKPERYIFIRFLITEKKKMMENMRDTNAFLDAIIENIPHMIFLKDAKELRFVRFNKAGEELLGFRQDELIGKNDYDFFPPDQADFFTQKDRKVLQAHGVVDIPSEPIQTRDKGERILHTKKICIMDNDGKPQYLLGISEDITEQRRQEDDLKKYQLAVESATDGIIITDAGEKILYANPAWCSINGYRPDEMAGKPVSMLKTEKTPAKTFRNLKKAMRSGRSFHSDEFINRRKDGAEYNADITIYPIRSGDTGDVQYWVGILADVTERKKADNMKSEFVSLASHQLRTPLSVMRLVIDTLLNGIKGPLNPDQKSLLSGARGYAKSMANTIGTLLSVSLSEEGKITTYLSDASLADILQNVCSKQRELLDEKKIHWSVRCDGNLTLITDRKLLEESISSILENAIRYTNAGGTIDIGADMSGDRMRISVQDSGIGIPANALESIFTKFFRAENAMTMCSDGSGLGLYLARSFVTLLGGAITVESKEGKGSHFTIELPASPPPHHDARTDRRR